MVEQVVVSRICHLKFARALGNYFATKTRLVAVDKASYNVEVGDQFEQTPSLSFVTKDKPLIYKALPRSA
ncbi:MAG: hypothetical protein U0521_00685 [Anaerolineae bacterium]